MGLSCTASHQDHHQYAQLHTKQGLPAPALGHHSKLSRKHQLELLEISFHLLPHNSVTRQAILWRLETFPSGSISHLLSSRCVLAEEEWSWWDWVVGSLTLTLYHFGIWCHDFTKWDKTHVLVCGFLFLSSACVNDFTASITYLVFLILLLVSSFTFLAHFFPLNISAT